MLSAARCDPGEQYKGFIGKLREAALTITVCAMVFAVGRVLLPNGGVRWIAGRGRVEFEGGKPLRMRGLSLDITERRQVELEAARQRMDLAHASRLTIVGELTASITHEISQPLGAILSNAETAEILLESKQPQLEEVQRILADASLTEAESADVKLLCDDIREFIKRTDTDKGGHVRAKLERIEAFRV